MVIATVSKKVASTTPVLAAKDRTVEKPETPFIPAQQSVYSFVTTAAQELEKVIKAIQSAQRPISARSAHDMRTTANMKKAFRVCTIATSRFRHKSQMKVTHDWISECVDMCMETPAYYKCLISKYELIYCVLEVGRGLWQSSY